MGVMLFYCVPGADPPPFIENVYIFQMVYISVLSAVVGSFFLHYFMFILFISSIPVVWCCCWWISGF